MFRAQFCDRRVPDPRHASFRLLPSAEHPHQVSMCEIVRKPPRKHGKQRKKRGNADFLTGTALTLLESQKDDLYSREDVEGTRRFP